MTTIVNNGITVDGVDLNSYAYNVETRKGRYDFASNRIPLIPVPNKNGQAVSGVVRQDVGIVALALWVSGQNEAGTTPTVTGNEATDWNIQFEKNMDKIHTVFGKQHGSLRLLQKKYDGTFREAYGYVSGKATADISSTRALAKVTYEITIPDVYWQDTADITNQLAFTSGGTAQFSGFTGATGPMEDLKFIIRGTVTNPILTDLYSGVPVLQYNGTITNQDLFIDCRTFRAYRNTVGAGAVTTGTDVSASLSHSGWPRLFAMLSSPQNQQAGVVTNGSSIDTTTVFSGFTGTSVSVIGRRKYHS